MIEEWRLIDNNFYISNFGNIKTLDNTYIDLSNRKSRYLKYKGYNIHRLVAETFIHNPENKREVNHINGNKHDNRVDNLEWVTTSENRIHAYKTGLQKPTYGYLGKHRTQEQKEKISKNNAKYWLGKHRSDETKQKLSYLNKGKKRTLEQKLKQKEAIQLWWKKRKEGDVI